MVSIRNATENDALAIARVHVASWRTTYRGIVPEAFLAALDVDQRAARWREVLATGMCLLVAEEDEHIVGFISGGGIREAIGDYGAELFAIYLLAGSQGKGIGRALLVELVAHLVELGFESMAVWVLEANASAGFYEKSGAVRVLSKEIEIGGVLLPVVAYGWRSLKSIKAFKL